MRILSVGNRFPPWSTGGYEATWAGAVDALRGRHDVRVLTTQPDPSDLPSIGAPPPDVYRELSWYWRAHRFPHRTLAQCVRLERANAAVLAAHRRDFSPDVVMWWAMGGMSLSLLEQTRRAGLPALGVVGDEWMVYGPSVDDWTRRWRRLPASVAEAAGGVAGVPARLALDRAGLWSFNSDYTRSVSRAAGWELAGATVDHPGISLGRLRRGAAMDWSWRLLYCGRIDPRKGIATAIRALPLLPDGAALTVHGEGDPEHAASLRRLAQELGVAGRVSFTAGPREQVAEVYAACDALVFPVTWREPWGLVPLEAMAVGRPVIATRAGGGAAEYLEHEVNCLQFAPEDAAGLADALLRVAGEAELREALVRRGSATAERFPEEDFHEALGRRLAEAVERGALA